MESRAAFLLQRAVPLSRAEVRESQSNGEYDIDLTWSGGAAAVEVTEHTSARTEELYSAIYGADGSRQTSPAPGCAGSWHLTLNPQANARRIRKEGTPYLLALESAGIEQFWVWDGTEVPEVRRIWLELRVESGMLARGLPHGQMMLNAPSQSVMVHVDSVLEAIAIEASKQDNVRKLAGSGSRERHLFVFMSEIIAGPREAVLNDRLPTVQPVLPEGITHCWVAARQLGQAAHVVWKYDRSTGWHSFGSVPLPELAYPPV